MNQKQAKKLRQLSNRHSKTAIESRVDGDFGKAMKFLQEENGQFKRKLRHLRLTQIALIVMTSAFLFAAALAAYGWWVIDKFNIPHDKVW